MRPIARTEPPQKVLRVRENGRVIDLRSDTCSRPTDAMRAAMADAVVGDDVLGDDPTVKELEALTASLLGKEDAVYVPSGTMANQIAVRLHARPGDALVTDELAHVVTAEKASLAGINGVTPLLLPQHRGVYDADVLRAALADGHPFFPPTMGARPALVWAENTHNNGGGAVWPAPALAQIAQIAADKGIATHLDGARLWHAAAASGSSEAELADAFDTVSVCFSKALGAPVGSALAGDAATIAEARRYKQQLGGGFRQAGIIAVGALHALREHRPILARTHDLAQRLATQIADIEGIVLDPASVETNIVRFELAEGGPQSRFASGLDAGTFCERLRDAGVFMLPNGPRVVRAVLYLDLTDDDVDRAVASVANVLAR